MRKFYDSYEYFWEYEYPFGEDFLKTIFDNNYQRKYSLIGDGIYNIVIIDDKIYSIDLKKATTLLTNDGKKAFRDAVKDQVVEQIAEKLKQDNIEYTVNSGKFISFKYNNFIFKIEVVKKAAMPA
jgi:hypothetical protein